MIKIYGNLFIPESYHRLGEKPPNQRLNIKPSAVAITTNGYVRRDGAAVMGRGCARQAANKWPQVPHKLGKYIRENGNIVQSIIRAEDIDIIAFPVKPRDALCKANKGNIVKHMQSRFSPGQIVPGWACIADINLISRSAIQLEQLATTKGWAHIVLPRPGCGAGELMWSDVEPVLQKILDDRFYSITFGGR